MNKTFIVAKYEYLSSIKRPTFWFTTLFFPIFIGAISLISGYTSNRGTEIMNKLSADIQNVSVVDEIGVIKPELIKEPLQSSGIKNESLEKLKRNEIDAVIIYPTDLFETNKIEVYTPNNGLLASSGIEQTAIGLLKQSGTESINNPELQYIVNNTFGTTTRFLDPSGNFVKRGFEQYIIPGVSAVVFFMIVFISAQFLLQSVSEEKENRMIESLLSIIDSRTLLNGKIFGLSALVITQQLVWILLTGLVLYATKTKIGFDFSMIDWSQIPWTTIPINIFFILAGFMLYAAIMVGVGAVGTSYKDSQGLSSIFVMMSIMPIYFITLIVAEPNGLIARATSIFPFTAPMVLLIRNSISTISLIELVGGIILVSIYVVLAFWFTYKLFDLGALLYNRRPTLKEIWHVMKKSS